MLLRLGSKVSDAPIKAVFVNFLSLLAGFEIGVATNVIVALSPTARLATEQAPPDVGPLSQEEETKFSGSGRASPKKTPVAVSGPKFVTVIVKVIVCPILTLFRSAVLLSARSALGAWAAAGDTVPPIRTNNVRQVVSAREVNFFI